MNTLTPSELVILGVVVVLTLRSVVNPPLTTTEAGLILGLLGLIPANRIDRRRQQ